jgi:hypothetical protein
MVTALVDMLAERYPERVPEWRMIAKVAADARTSSKAAAENRELTNLGQKVKIQEALDGGAARFADFDALHARRETEIANLKRRAVEPPQRTEAESRDETFAQERLAKLDPLMAGARYEQAIAEGNWTIINAVERATAAGFPTVSEASRLRAADLKIQHSKLAPEIAKLEAALGADRSVLNAARNALREIAESHGVRLDV